MPKSAPLALYGGILWQSGCAAHLILRPAAVRKRLRLRPRLIRLTPTGHAPSQHNRLSGDLLCLNCLNCRHSRCGRFLPTSAPFRTPPIMKRLWRHTSWPGRKRKGSMPSATPSAIFCCVNRPAAAWRSVSPSCCRRIWTWCRRRTTTPSMTSPRIRSRHISTAIGSRPVAPHSAPIMVLAWPPPWRYWPMIA